MNNFDITTLEGAVKAIVKELGVSSTVYNNRPKASDHKDDFVVVNVSGTIADKMAYGECTLLIALFAKDLNDIKNTKKLSYMQQKLVAGYPTTYDVKDSEGNVVVSYVFDDTPSIIGDTPDDFGYHARIFNVKTIITSI